MTEKILINLLILFYILQRISEMIISHRNIKKLQKEMKISIFEEEAKRMKVLHSLWFLFLIVEANLNFKEYKTNMYFPLLGILFFCMMMRLMLIKQLGKNWTIKILEVDQQNVKVDGLYRYIRHPNYLVVIIEFLCLPYLLHAYWTLVIFSLINFLFLLKRIKLEESILMKNIKYQKHFGKISKLIPFIFFFLIHLHIANAEEIKIENETYQKAKSNTQFVEFKGKSTKLGFIETEFVGYVKNASIRFKKDQSEIQNLLVEFDVKSLDTDLGARDSKMRETILDEQQFPRISVELSKAINLIPGRTKVDMIFTIKNRREIFPIEVEIKKDQEHYQVSGYGHLSIKAFNLPDPSIFVAKVDDKIDVFFNVIL